MGDNQHNHKVKVKPARAGMPKEELLCDLGDLFKVFGDTTRIRILYSLFESELTVNAITEILGMTQSAISHQLKVLKDANLVDCRREGKTMIYYLADDHVRTIIGQGYEHLTEDDAR
jgi:ArsR family transcriptional regulator